MTFGTIIPHYVSLQQVDLAGKPLPVDHWIREAAGSNIRQVVAVGCAAISRYAYEHGTRVFPLDANWPGLVDGESVWTPVLAVSIGKQHEGRILDVKRRHSILFYNQATGILIRMNNQGYFGAPKRLVIPIHCTGVTTNRGSRRLM